MAMTSSKSFGDDELHRLYCVRLCNRTFGEKPVSYARNENITLDNLDMVVFLLLRRGELGGKEYFTYMDLFVAASDALV